MKLYATTKSERASKGQGGNDFLDIDIFIIDKNNPTHNLRVFQNDIGHIWIKFSKYQFGKLQELTSDVIMPNLIKKVSPKTRLEQIRKKLKAERISYGDLAELQSLSKYIAIDDVELLEAAGVPEAKKGKK